MLYCNSNVVSSLFLRPLFVSVSCLVRSYVFLYVLSSLAKTLLRNRELITNLLTDCFAYSVLALCVGSRVISSFYNGLVCDCGIQ